MGYRSDHSSDSGSNSIRADVSDSDTSTDTSLDVGPGPGPGTRRGIDSAAGEPAAARRYLDTPLCAAGRLQVSFPPKSRMHMTEFG